MGSTKYFFREIGKSIKIKLQPEEMKYIITCVHTQHSPYSSFLKEIKPKITYAIKRDLSLDLKVSELFAFPTLQERIIFGQRDLLNYFESMGENSHNRILIGELKKIIESNPQLKNEKVLKSLVQHVYDCTVQVSEYKNGRFLVYTPNGLMEKEVDTRYLKGKLKNGTFITTHGKNKRGARYGVRILDDEEKINALKTLENLWNDLREECGI